MAEGLLDAALAQRLGAGHGVVVASAGVGAVDGTAATREAVAAAKERGADIARHRATRLTPSLARRSRLILCMTPSQVEVARQMAPSSDVRLLGTDGVPDPIGAGLGFYQEVADLIQSLVAPIADSVAATHAPGAR